VRRYEVVLSLVEPITHRRHEVEADGMGYHNQGTPEAVMVLYVDDKEVEGAQRAVFAVPVACLAYAREMVTTSAESRVDDLEKAMKAIEDLEPIHFGGAEHMGIPDGDYLPRAAVVDVIGMALYVD